MKDPCGKYIAAIFRHQQIIINHHLEPYNMTSGQYIFLISIQENQAISQKELSKLVKIDKATTAKALKKLETAGYIYRAIDKDDKRYNKLFVTEKGLEFIPVLKKALDSITNLLTIGVSDKEYKKMLEVLKRILDNAQDEVELLREKKDQT